MTTTKACLALALAGLCAGSIPFNTNDLPTDTTGTLPGGVLFAQHQIMPSKASAVAGDDQPHLTAQREVLVLFKPAAGLADDEAKAMTMAVRPGAGGLPFATAMEPPSKLPREVGYVADRPVRPDEVIFKFRLFFPVYLTSAEDLAELADETTAAASLAAALASTSTGEVQLMVNDATWAGPLYLLPVAALTDNGAFVSITNSASQTLLVHRVLPSGETFTDALAPNALGTYTAYNGHWWEKTDRTAASVAEEIVYGEGFWTARVPAERVAPGMVFTFAYDGLQGSLDGVDVGGASELLMHTIDIGMLTPPRGVFTFQTDVEAQKLYLETVPVSKMTVAQYAPLHLTEVRMPDGRTFTDSDPSEGTYHAGDMRQYIGKFLISHGIDLANYGVHDSPSDDETGHADTYYAAQLTAHNLVGVYSNGVVVHGLSGGNGIVTLLASNGNEFSHELGHNFGLGHYVGGPAGSIHRPANEAGSTWGWDSRTNQFVPNFRSQATGEDACCCANDEASQECVAPFAGRQFMKDAMASPQSPAWKEHSSYTLYTPHVSRISQDYFEGKAVFSAGSSTGFTKMDPATKQMVEWALPSGKVPTARAVAVTTIVGYYDPLGRLASYVYPAMHGSSGYVYAGGDASAPGSCELAVTTTNAGVRRFTLSGTRYSLRMNKFHVNVATADAPVSAEVTCNGAVRASRALDAPASGVDLQTTVNGEVYVRPSFGEVFSTGFETAGALDGWTTTGFVDLSSKAAQDGDLGLRLRKTSSATVAVDVPGSTTLVKVQFHMKVVNMDAAQGENVVVKVRRAGGDWAELHVTRGARTFEAYGGEEVFLGTPSSTTLELSFSQNCNEKREKAFIDNVVISTVSL